VIYVHYVAWHILALLASALLRPVFSDCRVLGEEVAVYNILYINEKGWHSFESSMCELLQSQIIYLAILLPTS
jgi:hypothetical protein